MRRSLIKSTLCERRLTAVGLIASILAVDCSAGEAPRAEALRVSTSTEALVVPASVLPTADVKLSHVWGGGGTTPIFALVDDGTSFSASNDNDFARSEPGAAAAALTLGYSSAPSGGASQVVVNHRPWSIGGAIGSVSVKLFDGTTLIGTGPSHAVTAGKVNLSDSFTGLAVLDAKQLRTEIDFSNTSGGTSSLGEALVWIDVTPPAAPPPSSERLHAAYPNAFVDNSTGQAVRLNGFNLRATGMNGWAVAQSHFDEIRAKGFNMMRLAMSWNDYEPAQGQFSASVLSALDVTIQRCKSAGLYVILDPIHANTSPRLPPWAVQSGDDDFATVLRSGVPYLQMLAARYANEPQVVAIDLVNEPKISLDSARLFDSYNTLMSAVRPIAPNKILVLEPVTGDVDPRKLDFSRLADKSNVVWSPHYYYAGGDDDGYSALGYPTGNFVYNGTSGYPVRNVAALDAHFMVTLNVMQTVHLPVWIGEYGIGIDVPNHDAWVSDVVSLLDAHDLSRTQWEYHWGLLAAVDNSYNFYPWVSLLTQ
jgi:hypothetical protein